MSRLISLCFFLFLMVITNCKDSFKEQDILENKINFTINHGSIPYFEIEVFQLFKPVIGVQEIVDSTFLSIKNISNLSFDSVNVLLHFFDEDILEYQFNSELLDVASGEERGPYLIDNATALYLEENSVKGWIIKIPSGSVYGGLYQGTIDGFTKDTIRVYSAWGDGMITSGGTFFFNPIEGMIKKINGVFNNNGRVNGQFLGETDTLIGLFSNADSTLVTFENEELDFSVLPNESLIIQSDTIQFFEVNLTPF